MKTYFIFIKVNTYLFKTTTDDSDDEDERELERRLHEAIMDGTLGEDEDSDEEEDTGPVAAELAVARAVEAEIRPAPVDPTPAAPRVRAGHPARAFAAARAFARAI